jgi:hypothetical protein
MPCQFFPCVTAAQKSEPTSHTPSPACFLSPSPAHIRLSLPAVLLSLYPQQCPHPFPCLLLLRPSCSSAITLPLGAIFGPVDLLLKKLPPAQAKQLAALPVIGAGFVPPVSVGQVAKVAVAAATDSSIAGGVIDDWQIRDWN